MELIAFKDSPALVDEFVELGFSLYRDDVGMIPSFRDEVAAKVSGNDAMYRVAGNDRRHFMVRHHGRAVGRVTAFVNRQLRDVEGTPVGTVGLFECIEDYDVARRLLDSAIEWLTAAKGLGRVWGPMDFDIWHGYRFMTSGFDREPFLGEPRNRPYYPKFFERYGFKVKAEWDSLEVPGRERIREMISRGESRYRYLLERGYRFEHLQRSHLAANDSRIRNVMLRAFSDFLGYTPLPAEEFGVLLRRGLPAFDPRLAILVHNGDHQPVGFAIACIELGKAVRSMRGGRGPWSRAKFLYHRRQSRTVNFYIGGMTPEEVARRSGLGRAGFYHIISNALAMGCQTVLLTLRLKGNLAHGLAARSNLKAQREYALYEWNHG